MTIAEYLRSISFEDIEEILWEVYGMGDYFTPFIKMTYDRICYQTGTSEHSYMIVQIVNSSIDPLGMNVRDIVYICTKLLNPFLARFAYAVFPCLSA